MMTPTKMAEKRPVVRLRNQDMGAVSKTTVLSKISDMHVSKKQSNNHHLAVESSDEKNPTNTNYVVELIRQCKQPNTSTLISQINKIANSSDMMTQSQFYSCPLQQQ